jgi:hypothetical protein
MTSWDVLICSIPHRDATLRELLAELDRQGRHVRGFGARIFRDNLKTPYGDKCAALLRSSQAEYVSFIDDDDMIAPDYVTRVMQALAGEPDYVGFPVRWTRDGAEQIPVEHSLRYPGWEDRGDLLARDLVQFNPVRRQLALMSTWSGGYAADSRWAAGLRDTGLVRREAWIPDWMYHYRDSAGDTFLTPRTPLPDDQIPPLPSYPWLTAI